MFLESRLFKTILVLIAVSASLATLPLIAKGRFPIVEEPSPLFTGKFIPEPPQQKDTWQPPESKVPKEHVTAFKLLFDQGMADPRGCEYRTVKVTTGNCWTGDAGVVRTHGWVLPPRKVC